MSALALITALASIQLMIKHRLFEEDDFTWLGKFEIRHKWNGYAHISKRKLPQQNRLWFIRFLQKQPSYFMWIIVYSLFAVAAGGVLYATGGALYEIILQFLNNLF